ncbi:unnamed protein product [Prunus brigantina]
MGSSCSLYGDYRKLIRSIEMVHKRFGSFPETFVGKLVSQNK